MLVTLDRPASYNALTFPMFDDLVALCGEVERDDDVRVVVLTGAGDGFRTGLDLEAVAALLDMSAAEFLRGQQAWAGPRSPSPA